MEGEESPELVAAWKKERRALQWTFGGLAVLSLVWSGHMFFGHIITKRLTELLSIGASLEANRYFLRMEPWLHASRTTVNAMSIVFLSSLMWWLWAIRHRRAVHAVGSAPPAVETRDSGLERVGKGK
ncbi:hypothetical protein OKA05_05085 [Luteolibacter arcticus]|uniref:Uncharacterized protein n=1 Tax=Luteolibacter arcticus TaxID=1581411 RepID=A0ABT3GE61_9BACT|nr:hypothetical protein [Luteolibacter arcticus]MCW1921915.1 hypothetical protein [Luteolibacter arcticus]